MQNTRHLRIVMLSSRDQPIHKLHSMLIIVFCGLFLYLIPFMIVSWAQHSGTIHCATAFPSVPVPSAPGCKEFGESRTLWLHLLEQSRVLSSWASWVTVLLARRH